MAATYFLLLQESEAALKESQTASEAERKASEAAVEDLKKKLEAREGAMRLRKKLWEVLAGPERQNVPINNKLVNEVVKEHTANMKRLEELTASNQARARKHPALTYRLSLTLWQEHFQPSSDGANLILSGFTSVLSVIKRQSCNPSGYVSDFCCAGSDRAGPQGRDSQGGARI